MGQTLLSGLKNISNSQTRVSGPQSKVIDLKIVKLLMSRLSRRDFVKNAALLSGSAITSPLLPQLVAEGAEPASAKPQPLDKLNIAIIGAGNQGRGNFRVLHGLDENIFALCDVDENQIATTLKQQPALAGAKVYSDYRKLLEQEKSLDAVVIATPDHWHAPIARAAMQAGKHVYCEKPLTHSIGEARELRELAKTSKVVTQMGNQGSASASLRRSIELIKAGVLGQIHEVHTYMPGGRFRRGITRPLGADPVPAGLNWDVWVGPAPFTPFKQGVYHPRVWRGWYDFGSGQLGDFGCHAFNLPMRALDLDYPAKVEIVCTGLGQDSYFVNGIIKLHFAARKDLAPVTLSWYDGGAQPPDGLFQDVIAVFKKLQNGVLLVGDKGIIFTNPWNMAALIKLKGEDRLQDVLHHEATKDIPVTLPRTRSHQYEWVQACKGGPATYSNFEVGGHLTEIVLSGVLAARLGRSIEWNGAQMEVQDAPASATKIIHPQYRQF